MTMEVPLRSALINYFVQLETTRLKFEDFVKSTKRPIQGLKNQSEQYCHVISKDVDNAEICELDDLRDRLVFKINVGIEDEISLILNELRRLKNHLEDLKMKFNRLEHARSGALLNEPNFKQLVDGTSHIPRLDLLMEWSIESYAHYNQLYVTLFENFKTLDYKNTNRVNEWAKTIDRIERDQGRIKYILGFTQFLVAESTK